MILLDTHVVFWLAAKPERLSRKGASAIRRALAGSGIAIASITLWELAHQFARGRIRGQGTTETFLEEIVELTGVVVREITPEIAALAGLSRELPGRSGGPLDRRDGPRRGYTAGDGGRCAFTKVPWSRPFGKGFWWFEAPPEPFGVLRQGEENYGFSSAFR